MHYVTKEQAEWLVANGLQPQDTERITLTEAAQWFWEKHRLDCSYLNCIGKVMGRYDDFFNTYKWGGTKSSDLKTIPEALSWAIDQAINHVNQQSNE